MKLLALETSGLSGAVALLDAGAVVVERELPAGQRSARGLAPAIQRALADAGWRTDEVRAVAVTSGPGSFTGLRIGVMTAKAFAWAIVARVVGVPTLAVIAAQAPAEAVDVVAVLDAQRRELFSQRFRRGPSRELAPIGPVELLGQQAWLDALPPGVWLAGPGLVAAEAHWAPLVRQCRVNAVPREAWSPRAATVGRLACARIAAGAPDALWTLVPEYHRPSAAEERRAAQGSGTPR